MAKTKDYSSLKSVKPVPDPVPEKAVKVKRHALTLKVEEGVYKRLRLWAAENPGKSHQDILHEALVKFLDEH